MQMFVLDPDPVVAAHCLADVHIRVIGREVSMCLSSWYARRIAHNTDELPYKAFNHPIVDEMSNRDTRIWATIYAAAIFNEFERRFGKLHASKAKFSQLRQYQTYYEGINLYCDWPDKNKARFTYVGIDDMPIPGRTVIKDLPIYKAVNIYQHYYRVKLAYMKVPVVYTKTIKPNWLEVTQQS